FLLANDSRCVDDVRPLNALCACNLLGGRAFLLGATGSDHGDRQPQSSRSRVDSSVSITGAKALATLSSCVSDIRGPTRVTPTGRLLGPRPAGIPTLGPCSSVHIELKIVSPVVCSPSGASPGELGVITTSSPAPNNASNCARQDSASAYASSHCWRVGPPTFSTRSRNASASLSWAVTYSGRNDAAPSPAMIAAWAACKRLNASGSTSS